MRAFKLIVLALLGMGLLTLSLANLDPVTLRLLPAETAAFLGWDRSVTMPLFLVILGGVLTGLVIGFIWEWLREHRFRVEAARARAEADRLAARLDDGRIARDPEADEMLALLEDRPRRP